MNLEKFLRKIEDATEIPDDYRIQRIIDCDIDEVACTGCHEDRTCRQPCVNSANCEDCQATPKYCDYALKCYECVNCGCDNCRNGYNPIEDNYDDEFFENRYDKFIERRDTIRQQVFNAMQQSCIPLEKWGLSFGPVYIWRFFPYHQFKEVWRKNVFEDYRHIICPKDVDYYQLPDEEKKFFCEPSDDPEVNKERYDDIITWGFIYID